MEQWSRKFKIRKTCQEEKELGKKRRKLDSSELVLLEKQEVDGCGSHRNEGGAQVNKQLMSTSRQLLPAPPNLC